MRPTLAASACVWRGEEVLIAKRAKPPYLWSLPGGHVEPGESLAEAARRELFEETGITAQFIGLVELIEVIRPDVHYVIACHAARFVSGEAQAQSDALDVAWVRLEALSRYEMTAGTPATIARAKALF